MGYVLPHQTKSALPRVPSGKRMPVVTKTSAYSVVTDDGGTVFNNTGATGSVTFTLPQIDEKGQVYEFVVTDADGITVDPYQTTGAFYVNGVKMADGQPITSTVIGSKATVVSDGNGDWQVSVTGDWNVSGPQMGGVQVIDMDDSAVTLSKTGASGTRLTGTTLLVDPKSGGSSENLDMPPEADCAGMTFLIYNTGGEHIALRNDAAGAIITIEDGDVAMVACDGTSWTAVLILDAA